MELFLLALARLLHFTPFNLVFEFILFPPFFALRDVDTVTELDRVPGVCEVDVLLLLQLFLPLDLEPHPPPTPGPPGTTRKPPAAPGCQDLRPFFPLHKFIPEARTAAGGFSFQL